MNPGNGPDWQILDPTKLEHFLGGVFQANPLYELVRTAEIAPSEREMFNWLNEDSDLYGILRPRANSRLSAKSVCLDTAALFQNLQQPKSLPESLIFGEDDATTRQIAELVLDGVLTYGANGKMLWGPSAFAALCTSQVAQAGTPSVTLAMEALHYGSKLAIDDPVQLASRLYFYGRVPLSPRWLALLPGRGGVMRHLGVEPGGRNARRLLGGWTLVDSGSASGWLAWKSVMQSGKRIGATCSYKLYISPRPEHVRDAFDELVAELVMSDANAFKVGQDALGLLRSDKIMVYFDDWEPLESLSRRLRARLAGCPAHGVPFTAGFDDGELLLSWGSDPPEVSGMPPWLKRISWRQWVTNQLGVYLGIAKRFPHCGTEAWKFALECLRLKGIDVSTWSIAR